jgi:bifunctional DNase/RNase
MQGRIVQESDKSVKSANISSLPAGIYFVTLTTETGKSVKKIIKE